MLNLQRNLIVIALATLPFATARATDNECQAEVRFLNVTPSGAGTKFSFAVKTKCERSTGQFDYSFTDGETGRPVERTTIPWKGTAGMSFTWTDEFPAPAAAVKDVKVKNGSIKSTKV